MSRDTIAALATARGVAALAVVRASGPEAVPIVASRFSGAGLADAPGRTVHLGWLTDADRAPIDQVVCVVWRGPHSSTGEDVVEVTCHGGDAVAGAVLRALFEAGARPATAGEFTQRAFLNGKLDLAQAEAVADLIAAESRLGVRTAVAALRGRVSDAVDTVRQSLLQTAALVELELDFAEEDVAFADRTELRALLERADAALAELAGTARLGALVRDGVRVVLGGRPNAGKSTLLNALTGQDRAIVSPTPGTTRDAIEAEAEIGGLRFRFLDTAGLRETADAIEAEGTRRARAAIDGADVLAYVVDATMGLDAEERTFLDGLAARRPDLPMVLVANKTDLVAEPPPADTAIAPLRAASAVPLTREGDSASSLSAAMGDPQGERPLPLSARDALADPAVLDTLRQRLLDAVRAGGLDASGAGLVAVNERHRAHLEAARQAVGRAQQSLDAGDGGDTLALDLRAALHELGLVTGAVTTEDVLDAVFSQFCIGK
ncbi:tRNA uridine-5-carboxymethylaminomethyl(34) synthesis GTPase MnmE [Rubrivirga sp. IMCC43871]|uniref:tRNA uridine-5-carboxymethylaminomethyl(34) synthesis GTPase MnmE n=1 Tax=Rubrivirga sp. IMCC43871 TaxID=3391575 RepID=UPI00398F8FFD